MVTRKNIKIVLPLIFFCAGFSCYSQDTLRLVNKEILVVKIFEIDVSEIRYKKTKNPDGPMYVVSKSNVESITYQNNVVEIYTKTKAVETKPVVNAKTGNISAEPDTSGKTNIKNTITLADLRDQYQSQTLKNNYILHLKDGSIVSVKIIKVTDDKIIYRNTNFLTGPMYYSNTKEVVNIE